MSTNMRFSTKMITVAMAKKWLKKNKANFRALTPSLVNKYARDIKAGEWDVNACPIKFAPDGSLLDGQHRLAAIVMAGVGATMTVAANVPSESMLTMDRGRPRSVAAWLSHLGFKNCNVMAAVSRMVMSHDEGIWSSKNSSPSITDHEVIAYCKKHKAALNEAIHLAMKSKALVTTALMAAVLHVGCNRQDPNKYETAKWLVARLADGIGLMDDDAVLHFRNHLLRDTPTRKTSRRAKSLLLTMAWNFTATEQPCSKAQMRLRLTGPTKVAPPNEIVTLPKGK